MIRSELREKQRALREARMRSTTQTLRSLHRGYYYAALAVVGVTVAGLGIRWFLQYQRQTTLALAQMSGAEPAPSTTAAVSPSSGMPNPLQSLPLSEGAAYVIGANVKTNDKGEPVGITELPPQRSSSAMTQLLQGVDLCKAYVSLGAVADVVITFEATPGAYPLIDPSAEMCAAAITPPVTATPVPVPSDPIPPTTLVVPAS